MDNDEENGHAGSDRARALNLTIKMRELLMELKKILVSNKKG
jgi:hypothetical protein